MFCVQKKNTYSKDIKNTEKAVNTVSFIHFFHYVLFAL